jgi:hypothetical protein
LTPATQPVQISQSVTGDDNWFLEGVLWIVGGAVGVAGAVWEAAGQGFGRSRPSQAPAISGTQTRTDPDSLSCNLNIEVEQQFSRSASLNHMTATVTTTAIGSGSVRPINTAVEAVILGPNGSPVSNTMQQTQQGNHAQVVARYNEPSYEGRPQADADTYGIKAKGACQFSDGRILRSGTPTFSSKRHPDGD